MIKNIRYGILPYPKGKNMNYILGEFQKVKLVKIKE